MKHNIFVVFIAAFLTLFMAGIALADKDETPTTLAGGKVVTPTEVKALIGKPGVHIYDMRKAINFGKGHIPGAVSLVYEWTSKDDDMMKRTGTFPTEQLPKDKNATLVFYSDGPTGWKSYKAAAWAVENGYKNVLYMREGSAGWELKNFPLEN